VQRHVSKSPSDWSSSDRDHHQTLVTGAMQQNPLLATGKDGMQKVTLRLWDIERYWIEVPRFCAKAMECCRMLAAVRLTTLRHPLNYIHELFSHFDCKKMRAALAVALLVARVVYILSRLSPALVLSV
jgi:hypothetical protein